jgi:hypothetical protein
MKRITVAPATFLLAAAALVVVAASCGGGSTGLVTTGSGTCASGCTGGQVCAYPIADGCSAKGQCVSPPAPLGCNAICELHGCGCDGAGTVTWAGCCSPALPEGYAPAPVTSSQTCP